MDKMRATGAGLYVKIKWIAGWCLLLLGIPLYVLPVPLGIFFLMPGIYLLVCTSPDGFRSLDKLEKRFPRIHRFVSRLCRRCTPSLKQSSGDQCPSRKSREVN